ncbi:MAG: sulfotransferase [Nitrospira sp.]|nr:sulfotransferase [Nitrospira sp.]
MINTIKRSLAMPLESSLGILEDHILSIKGTAQMTYAPIFIIGPPRSGSTLLYQIMTRYFKVCYFSNLMMRFPKSPITIAKLVSLIYSNKQPEFNFTNMYGETMGWKQPNQGILFWNRWFPNDNSYVGSGVISNRTIKGIRNTVALLQQIFDAPFVNKWQTNSVRILPLYEALPEALFVRIKRQLPFVAQSILIGKRKLFKDEMRWFSSKPKNYEQIKNKKPIEQVCEQVFSIEKDIDRDSKVIGENKFFTVHYEELCECPELIMNNIKKFYDKIQNFSPLGVNKNIPLSFQNDNVVNIPEDFNFIKTYLHTLVNGEKDKIRN